MTKKPEAAMREPYPRQETAMVISREELPEPEEVGVVDRCPFCSTRDGYQGNKIGPTAPVICEPGRRLLHQRCRACGARWVRKMGAERFV